MKCELDASIRSSVLYTQYIHCGQLPNWYDTHGTHIAFVSTKKERGNSDENIIFRSPLLGDMAESMPFQQKCDACNQTKCSHHGPSDTSLSYVRRTIIDEIRLQMRIWIGRCCHRRRHMSVFVYLSVCEDQYELVNIWLATQLYSNALKPIIEPLINLNLLRLCHSDINMCWMRLDAVCVCMPFIRHVRVQFEFTIVDF